MFAVMYAHAVMHRLMAALKLHALFSWLRHEPVSLTWHGMTVQRSSQTHIARVT